MSPSFLFGSICSFTRAELGVTWRRGRPSSPIGVMGSGRLRTCKTPGLQRQARLRSRQVRIHYDSCEDSYIHSKEDADMDIKKVGVLGCGLMGSGIAQTAATAGFDVLVLEQEQKFLDRGFAGVEKSLSRMDSKGGVSAQQKADAQARLKGTTSMADLADCDIVIEAIIENVAEKRKTYAELDSIVKKDAIFASNTSSISITELMTATKRPERFIGLHFFNPVPMMKMVEVV